jgi:putative transposase
MPRKLRRDESGLIHHACMHAVNDELAFVDDSDRIGYLLMLAATVKRHGWLCLAYCLMDNHIHLLIETPEPNFAAGMRWLHGHYGRCFNKQHDRSGHLFQGRYHDEPVVTEAHLLSTVGYIAMNPVEAGLCRDPADWQWGSHHRVARGAAAPWMAHDYLVERLQAISGLRGAYDELIAARLRAY